MSAVLSELSCPTFVMCTDGRGLGLKTQIRTATKRGGGSSKNGRDSAGKRLGAKKFTSEWSWWSWWWHLA